MSIAGLTCKVLIGHCEHIKKLFGGETKENPCKANKTYNNDAGSVLYCRLNLLKETIYFTLLLTGLKCFVTMRVPMTRKINREAFRAQTKYFKNDTFGYGIPTSEDT